MSFSTRMQATAQRLLSLYGQTIAVVRTTLGSYNTDTGECTTLGTSTYSGWGNPGTYSELELLNTNILQSDIKLYFYSSTRPQIGDSLSWNDVDYRVQDVLTTSAQGSDCLYQLQLRVG
jgi:hypothetical protein